MAYRDTCTPEQIAILFTPDTRPESPLGLLQAARAAGRNVTMTDILSEIASKDRPMRYVDGKLFRAK